MKGLYHIKNYIYLFIYLIFFLVSLQFLVFFLFTEKNILTIDQLQIFLQMYPKSYHAIKKDLIIFFTESATFIKQIEIETNIYKLTQNIIVISIEYIMFIVHKLIISYTVFATFVYNIIIIWWTCYFFFWLFHYYWIGYILRIFYMIKNMEQYTLYEIACFWDERWKYFLDRTIFLLAFFLMIHSNFIYMAYLFPILKIFVLFQFSWINAFYNANYRYILSATKWNMLN
jgi:hypothetical protein